MECFVVMECIYNVHACKTAAKKLFGQQWLFKKVKERNTNDMETDNDSEE